MKNATETLWAKTRDGWELPLHRFAPTGGESNGRLPALLLHGYQANGTNFNGPGRFAFAPWLASKGREAWIMEFRGSGASRPPGGRRRWDWNLSTHVREDLEPVVEELLRITGARALHLVGHSLGGMILYHAAIGPQAAHLASGTAIGAPTFQGVRHGASARLLDRAAPLLERMRVIPTRGPARRAGALLRRLQPVLPRTLAGFEVEVGIHLAEHIAEDGAAEVMREFVRWMRAGGSHGPYGLLEEKLHISSVPLQFLVGAADGLASPHSVERGFEAAGGKGRHRLVVAGVRQGFRTDYGHGDPMFGVHAREEIWPLISEWMERHDPGRS